ncbi:FAD/NAD(P)-binding domain-containing protein [Sarocladium strictum]
MRHDVDVLIIGAGMSGIGLGVQLIQQHKTRNFEIIEKSRHVAGTWSANTYPGCGCDVPSHFYSYSFALNPNWSRKFALQPEIQAYFEQVALQYNIPSHTQFGHEVVSASWDDAAGVWIVKIRDLKTTETYLRRAKILISAAGALSIPRKCDIPGAASYRGRMFHTAKWDHSFDWKDKNVVVIGNGCSATQVVPCISEGSGAAKRVTQFSRQAHWLAERPNPEYAQLFRLAMKYIPLLMRAYRAKLYWEKERDFRGFDLITGKDTRRKWTAETIDYIRKNSPSKYHDFLVPKSEIGCKRRVNDTDYLLSLHRPNVELVYDDPAAEITEDGVRTESGRFVPADAIVLANGFETQKFLFPMEIRGRDGADLYHHGVPSSYLGTCVSGFPNFFMMMGPNTLSGHLSVIYTTECQINFAMRLIAPVLRAVNNSRSRLPSIRSSPDVVEVHHSAEAKDIEEVQEKASKLVWASGCTSWFIETVSKRNSIMFPDWQYQFWLRTVFIRWKDFSYTSSKNWAADARKTSPGAGSLLGVVLSIAIGAYVSWNWSR